MGTWGLYFAAMSLVSNLTIKAQVPLYIFICLWLQQQLSGFIHESSHHNLIKFSHRWNDRICNLLACRFFLYDVRGFRVEHFRHHQNRVFLNAQDQETAPTICKDKKFFWKCFLGDFLGVTALRLGRVRGTSPDKIFTKKNIFIAFQNIVFYLVLSYFASPLAVIIYIVTLLLLYPATNRIRVWATHGDSSGSTPFENSKVSRNIHSPIWERIFLGNKMHMYHYEHHLNPSLSFRECEKIAKERIQGLSKITTTQIYGPSYVKIIRDLLATKNT